MTPFDLELDAAVGLGVQRVIAATAHILTRMEFGATLTHQDVASDNHLATESFNAQAFRLGIATVAG